MLRKSVSAKWIRLVDSITALVKTGVQTLDWDAFAKLASECSIEQAEAKEAAQFLHEVGSIVYFDDPYSALGSLVVIDPQFLAQVMSTVVG